MDVVGFEQELYRSALLVHAQEVRSEARRTVAHSQALRLVLDDWKGGGLASRCAWCSRYRVDGEWVAVRVASLGRRNHTTHTMCDDCSRRLREAGMSA